MREKKNVKRKKTIILTGGGSAGHVIPNLLLLPDLLADGWDVHYIGSRNGIEAQLARRDGITYHAIETGKMRRYFDLKNITDPFRVVAGIIQSFCITARLKPRVIFSKGGFVAVPVVLGGWLLQTPSVIHESDLTQGLANKICAPFSKTICSSFEKTISFLSVAARKKAVYTGAPVRSELAAGNAGEGFGLCGFNEKKPVLLAIGGSQGSENLNAIIREALPLLLKDWQVAHVCGKGHIVASLTGTEGYAQFEYARDELAHLYKISRAAVSRAGSGTLFELLLLRIPAVLIPLPLSASRGDQVLNAEEFSGRGFCLKLDESEAKSPDRLNEALHNLSAGYDSFVNNMRKAGTPDSKGLILHIIYEAAGLI
jgi:UDP-N-acetylglucosamine--N-acetylmuramyl-(pentapeptide) pyrophosphoryl-undecaprenol N-acetylglucosamine transferase